MKIIKPSVEVLYLDKNSILKNIEKAGRTCYKSEDRITEDSAEKFVDMILKRNHEAMIEFGWAIVKVICDRGVTHEIVRHRLFSYAQECVTGDTIIKLSHKKSLTIKELYERQENGTYYDKTHNKTINLKMLS